MKFARVAVLTICSFAVFALTMTFAPLLPAWGNHAARSGLLLVFGVLWLAARGERFGPYRPAFFAFFTAAAALSLSYYFSDYGLAFFHLTTKTPAGIAVAKASQALLVVIGIVVLAKLSGEGFGSLYIRKGRLVLGLCLGFAGAAIFVCLTFLPGGPFFQPASTAGGLNKLLPLAPWVFLFVLCNAFMEELLFRGLLLGRYEPLTGKWLALISTALVFALAHMQVSYTAQVAGFVAFVFVLGFLWGLLMQKTKSIWGSVLFHAGADLAIILPIFQQMTHG